MTISGQDLLATYPPSVPVSAQQVRDANATEETPILVVLDDDPTGTQSVADLPVLTAWTVTDLDWALATGKPAIYVMTNSRSLSPEDARRVNQEVVDATYAALDHHPGVRVAFVSRSDSTLRGHFPLEPDTLADAVVAHTGQDVDGVVIVPAFGDAGRITVGGVHYAGSDSAGYTPVGETEFAKDATFGYRASNLAQWVEEKTGGAVAADQVIRIDLTQLRTDHEGVVAALRRARCRQPITCDIVTEDDLRLLSLALAEAEQSGSRFIYRVGPPFVRARIGQEVKAPLSPEEVQASRGKQAHTRGGLVVVGSHVDLTTRQLNHLVEHLPCERLVLEAQLILDDAQRESHLTAVVDSAVSAVEEETVVVQTSRALITGEDGQASLEISRRISAAVVEVVQRILARTTPAFVIAKGGITSSDVASKGLQIRHANVVGPMLPGIVSLWSGQDGPAAGIPYIVFAGNVGDETSLSTVVKKLTI